MTKILRAFFYLIIGKFIILILCGIDVKNGDLLPRKGPGIIVANHNSHLDILLIMSILPWRAALCSYPVAAADYFLRNKIMAWFSRNITGIVPINRKPSAADRDILKPCYDKLDCGKLLIIFPEGSRGEPEIMGELKNGVAHIIKNRPNIPVYPVFIHGLGKTLPRGEALFVPFICKIFVGKQIVAITDKTLFMQTLSERFESLSHQERLANFE